MAGYIFALGNRSPHEIYQSCVERGVYSTFLRTISPVPFEGTLADYATMKEGDTVYFFFQRRIYGMGTLVRVGPDCKYANYPCSCKLETYDYADISRDLLVDYGEGSPGNRWICTFIPGPAFFAHGVDMDDVLSYKPDTFKLLRAFWKASFIKLGEEENQSLREIILLRNQENGDNILPHHSGFHEQLAGRLTDAYLLNLSDLLQSCSDGSRIRHEMAIEAATLHRLASGGDTPFGRWDYLSHQVPASPFKPIDYMDKIDIFACRFLPATRIISNYMVIEIKKDVADMDAVTQVCKYVDWVCREYAFGDYSAIEGYVLAHDFTRQAIEEKDIICKRNYTRGTHPIENREWSRVKLVKYAFDGEEIQYTML